MKSDLIVSDVSLKTKNNWKILGENPKEIEKELIKYGPLIRKLLVRRGLTTQEEAEKYLNPDYERDISDPFLMTDMDKAVRRILLAIEKKEKVMIFGDYDADGVPASALLASFFRMIGFENFEVYIPHRHKEQYGLSLKSVKQFAKDKFSLLITVDCGITSFEEVALANKLGLDVIVTDHHLVPDVLPEAVAVVDPKRLNDAYPDKMLCGAGVAFKLVQALIKKGGFDLGEGQEKWLLDLVAIATVSDMVPITNENRVLAYFGLKVLNQTKRLGLIRLFQAINLKKGHITETDIAFLIGPRINSAGRMSHASEAYYLLMTEDKIEAETITKKLEKQNRLRRSLVDKILDSDLGLLEKEVLVLGDNSWNIGVLGLAAGRLSEKHKKTVFVWAKNENGEIKGSCRSNGEVDVVGLMKKLTKDSIFLDFGGHSFAGGFSLLPENLPALDEKLNEYCQDLEKISVDDSLIIDEEINLADVTVENYREIQKLGPFGLGNEAPNFLFRRAIILQAETFGKEKNHLRLVLADEDNARSRVSAIAFFACPADTEGTALTCGQEAFAGLDLSVGAKIALVANMEMSYFMGRNELRLRIIDMIQEYD